MDIKGKTILCLGDSITASSWYLECLRNLSSANKVVNYGVGGTTIAKRKKPLGNFYDYDFIMRAKEMQDTADLIIVFGGTNDYGHGDVPIGSIDDDTHDTFSGNIKILIKTIKEKYPATPIVFITPLHRVDDENPYGENGAKPYAMGTLKDYVDMIKAVAEKEGTHILDFYNDSDFSLQNEQFRSFISVDGLHPNEEGHKVIANKIYQFVKKL